MYEHNFWFGDQVMRVVVTASDPNVSLEGWLLFAIMLLVALGMSKHALDAWPSCKIEFLNRICWYCID